MAKNEQDVIEPFLRHNSQYADLVVLIDNCSTDETKRIALDTARDLKNVVVLDFFDPVYNQSTTTSQALRYVQSACFAEYIFFLDADEFLQVGSRSALEQQLALLPPRTIGLLPWRDFIPDPKLASGADADPLSLISLLRTNDEAPEYKAVLRLAGDLDPSLYVAQGNHLVINAHRTPLPSKVLDDVFIAHLPVRSSGQLLAKGAVGWRANIRRKDFTPEQGSHWKKFHDLAAEGRQLSPPELALEALNYTRHHRLETLTGNVVEHRPMINAVRRYSNGQYSSWKKMVADYESNLNLSIPPLPLREAPPAGRPGNAPEGLAAGTTDRLRSFDLDEPPFRFAIELFRPRSVMHVGSGAETYPLLYRHLGVEDVWGICTRAGSATGLKTGNYLEQDVNQPFDLDRTFDLLIDLDPSRQLAADEGAVAFDNMVRHASGAIICCLTATAQPVAVFRKGMGIPEVLGQWARRGWHPDLPLTLGLRAISTLQDLRRNLLVLRPARVGSDRAKDILAGIARRKYHAYAQEPGPRMRAFSEKYPETRDGYGSGFGLARRVDSFFNRLPSWL